MCCRQQGWKELGIWRAFDIKHGDAECGVCPAGPRSCFGPVFPPCAPFPMFMKGNVYLCHHMWEACGKRRSKAVWDTDNTPDTTLQKSFLQPWVSLGSGLVRCLFLNEEWVWRSGVTFPSVKLTCVQTSAVQNSASQGKLLFQKIIPAQPSYLMVFVRHRHSSLRPSLYFSPSLYLNTVNFQFSF